MDSTTAKKIISCLFEKSDKWFNNRSSYGLKHDVEYYAKDNNINCDKYISNTDFKELMKELNFEFKSIDNNDYYKLKPFIDSKNLYKNKIKLHNLELKLDKLDLKIDKFKSYNVPFGHLNEEKNEILTKINDIKLKVFGKPYIF